MNKDVIIEKVKEFCFENGLIVNHALIKAGVGKDFLVNIKRGSAPSIELVSRFAECYNISLDYLCGRTENTGSLAAPLPAIMEKYSALTDELKSVADGAICKLFDDMQKQGVNVADETVVKKSQKV